MSGESSRAMNAEPAVRSLTVDDIELYYRVDGFAFGDVNTAEQIEAKRPLFEPGRFLLVEIDGEPAGVAASFRFDLVLPGGYPVAVSGVSDVGVMPTQRRRGALRALMARQLDDAAGRGEAAAVLNASETRIYGRFGYGIATRVRMARIVSDGAAFRPEWTPVGGRCSMHTRTEALDIVPEVYRRACDGRAGSLLRTDEFWRVVLGATKVWIGGGRDLLVMVHRDRFDRPDGFAIYRLHAHQEGPRHLGELEVLELMAVDDGAELALWRALLDHDLVARLTAPIPVDHLLYDVLVDPRLVGVEFESDHLWVRLLDVAAVLSRRFYATDDELVLAVADTFRPATAGVYRLRTSGDRSTCERIDAHPGNADLALDIADLGGAVLGDGSFQRLVRAGRVVELSAGAARRADAAFGVTPLPWCGTRF